MRFKLSTILLIPTLTAAFFGGRSAHRSCTEYRYVQELSASAEVRSEYLTMRPEPPGDTLTGVGLVVGLNGRGGSSAQTKQWAKNQFFEPDGCAVVSVRVLGTGNPEIDIVDDASSLKGGRLLKTPLYGIDGKIYATAAGTIGDIVVEPL